MNSKHLKRLHEFMNAEDELKAQGIHDDEEQKLLSDLRLKVSRRLPFDVWINHDEWISYVR